MAPDENQLKAELRALTAQTRKIRQDLRSLMSSAESRDLTRGMTRVATGRSARRTGREALAGPSLSSARPAARKKR